jgi:hypothetical protein
MEQGAAEGMNIVVARTLIGIIMGGYCRSCEFADPTLQISPFDFSYRSIAVDTVTVATRVNGSRKDRLRTGGPDLYDHSNLLRLVFLGLRVLATEDIMRAGGIIPTVDQSLGKKVLSHRLGFGGIEIDINCPGARFAPQSTDIVSVLEILGDAILGNT